MRHDPNLHHAEKRRLARLFELHRQGTAQTPLRATDAWCDDVRPDVAARLQALAVASLRRDQPPEAS